MGRFGSFRISCCCTRASCIFFVPDFYEDCLYFLGQRIKRFDVILKKPEPNHICKVKSNAKQSRNARGKGKELLEDQTILHQNEKPHLTTGLFQREDLTWSNCQHSLRSVVFRRDSGFLISHDGLIEKNPIKSEEFPASEYTMCIENCSSKKSRDDLQLLVTAVQVQLLGKWQYIQDFFSYCFYKREFLPVYDSRWSDRVLHTGSHSISF